ncbi:hypothetical protein L1047_01520 [Synechococcus sp. Nb3U1]|uniref:hypothetical protein n=1 Tax=Synechococcus sp. Nb3U1 TaxID=1914529 RepID=UPI001F284EE8|nr:hypothetical protein [Synechococcus sp. Nb3U1]MCF2969873.1 hypothetical protein [Synechococcus sp. Nb3U1]
MASASPESRLDRIEQLLGQEAEAIRQLRQTQAEESEWIRLAQEQESQRICHIREQNRAEEQKLMSDLRTQQALLDESVAGVIPAVEDRHKALLEFGQVIPEAVEKLRASHRRQNHILDDWMGQQPPREGEP